MSRVAILKGTGYEQGFQHGEQLREVIWKNVGLVRQFIVDHNVDTVSYNEFNLKDEQYWINNVPELIEEMHGIADGSGISYADILLLNLPNYFMKDHFKKQECSMILARGDATLDHKTYIIKNRDMGLYLEQAIMHREYPDGVRITEVNGAGTVTYPAGGLNSYGVAATNTGFWSDKSPSDYDHVGEVASIINSHVILRSCKTAREGLEWALNLKRMNGLHLMIADRKEAFLIEITKDDAVVFEDDGSGLMFRSNHFQSEKLKGLNPTPDKYPSTHFRYARLKELLEEKKGSIRFQDLFRIMSDHENGVNCICRHPHPGYPARTMSATMIVLEDEEVWTTIGNPCECLPHAAV